MRKSVKAVLFSSLVFPGTGHFSLKRYPRGLIFFMPALLSLLYLVQYAVKRANEIIAQIEQGAVPLDINAYYNLLSAPPAAATILMLNIATWLFVASWIASIIDSFILGRIQDQAKK
jgi:hypothetical protein